MEMSFSDLRTKEVINTNDGRRLGKVCDIVFCYPENRVIGIVAPGGKGFSIWKNEQFIDMKNIVKIGDDVVLVNFNMPCGAVLAVRPRESIRPIAVPAATEEAMKNMNES